MKLGIQVDIKAHSFLQIRTVLRKVSHKLVELGRIIGEWMIELLEYFGCTYPPATGALNRCKRRPGRLRI